LERRDSIPISRSRGQLRYQVDNQADRAGLHLLFRWRVMREPRFLVSRIAEVDMEADCCLNEPIIRRDIYGDARKGREHREKSWVARVHVIRGGEREAFLPSRLPFATVRTPRVCGFNDPCVQSAVIPPQKDAVLYCLHSYGVLLFFSSPFCVATTRPRIARNAARKLAALATLEMKSSFPRDKCVLRSVNSVTSDRGLESTRKIF